MDYHHYHHNLLRTDEKYRQAYINLCQAKIDAYKETISYLEMLIQNENDSISLAK